MTTPPPDTKAQRETPEEIAHRLVEQVYATQVPTRFALYSDILSALCNERTRAARIIKEHRESDASARITAGPPSRIRFSGRTVAGDMGCLRYGKGLHAGETTLVRYTGLRHKPASGQWFESTTARPYLER